MCKAVDILVAVGTGVLTRVLVAVGVIVGVHILVVVYVSILVWCLGRQIIYLELG